MSGDLDEFRMPKVRKDYAFIDCLKYNEELKDDIRIVLVGDTGNGKTSAIVNYMENRFFNEYKVTVATSDVYRERKNVLGVELNIEIQDTSGLDTSQKHRVD